MHLVIDIGGTQTRIATFDKQGNLSNKSIFSTPSSFETGIELIYEKIKLISEISIDDIVIGIPGTIDRKEAKILKTPNLASWSNKHIGRIISEKFKVDVKLANDAELGALGEAIYGAGKDFRSVAYLTISTGIGGALVIDKKLVPRVYNSEPGHTVIDLSSHKRDELGISGSFEALASGKSFEKIYGIKPEKCKDSKLWNSYSEILGQGVINVILMWSPEAVIIGGGLSNAAELLFGPLQMFVSNNQEIFPCPKIIKAKLADNANLYGGLAILLKQ